MLLSFSEFVASWTARCLVGCLQEVADSGLIEAMKCSSVSEGDTADVICLIGFRCKPEAVGIIAAT